MLALATVKPWVLSKRTGSLPGSSSFAFKGKIPMTVLDGGGGGVCVLLFKD